MKPVKKATPFVKKAVPAKKAPVVESSYDSSSEEPVKPVKKAAPVVTKAAPVV